MSTDGGGKHTSRGAGSKLSSPRGKVNTVRRMLSYAQRHKRSAGQVTSDERIDAFLAAQGMPHLSAERRNALRRMIDMAQADAYQLAADRMRAVRGSVPKSRIPEQDRLAINALLIDFELRARELSPDKPGTKKGNTDGS